MDMNVTNPKTNAAHAPLACTEMVVVNTLNQPYDSYISLTALELHAYQDGCVLGSNIKVDCADADGHEDVNQEPQPVIPKIPGHVDERALGQGASLHQKAGLAAT